MISIKRANEASAQALLYSASQDPVDGRWSLVIISPSFHFWGILEQSRINIEWLKVNCFKIFSTYHMI